MERALKSTVVISILFHLVWLSAIQANGQSLSGQKTILSIERIWDRAEHNAFTDLIEYNDRLFCTFREGTGHVPGINGSIRVIASDDGQNWYSVAHLFEEDVDLRDPKLSVTPDNRLMLNMGGSYYDGRELLKRESKVAFSYRDGTRFSQPETVIIDRKIRTDNDWLWRVTWHKGTGYGVVYQAGEEEYTTHLVRTTDGIHYTHVKSFGVTGRPNETSLRFTEDDIMVALMRRESEDHSGYIGTSKPPYTEWNWRSTGVRLGGPNFILLNSGTGMCGTRDYTGEGTNKTGIARIDTSGRFEYLVTLPSGGDTSYPGLVRRGNRLLVTYYSSHEDKTAIYLTRLILDRLVDSD